MAAEPDYELIVADRDEARSLTSEQREDRYQNWQAGELR